MAAKSHGHCSDEKRSGTYNSWRAAVARCHYPRHPYFPIYGGRGIAVCDRWRGVGGFGRFLADVGERPPGMTLDRIDPDGDYEPGNVRWATPVTQRWNRRDMALAREQLQLDTPTQSQPAVVTEMPF
jgi:hypothetical protein